MRFFSLAALCIPSNVCADTLWHLCSNLLDACIFHNQPFFFSNIRRKRLFVRVTNVTEYVEVTEVFRNLTFTSTINNYIPLYNHLTDKTDLNNNVVNLNVQFERKLKLVFATMELKMMYYLDMQKC